MTKTCPSCRHLSNDDAVSCCECGRDLRNVKARQSGSSAPDQDEVYVLWDFPPFAFFRTVSQTKAQFRFTTAVVFAMSTLVCLAVSIISPILSLAVWSVIALTIWASWRVGTLNAQIVRKKRP